MVRYWLVASFAVVLLSLNAGCKDTITPPKAGAAALGESGGGGGAPGVEAKENLRAIGTGAELYYQTEHTNPDDPAATVVHAFPASADTACSAGGESAATEPSATDWVASPWKELGFAISRPHRFAYCYRSSPDGKRFAAWAETDSTAFCLKGTGDGAAVRLAPVVELTVDQYCEY